MLKHAYQDLRFSFRQWRARPAFTATTVLTLALGIGANLTVFLIVYGVLLRPLPFPQPEQLVRIERFYPDGTLAAAYSGTKALFFARSAQSLESLAAYDYIPGNVTLVRGEQAVPLKDLRVTASFFHVLGIDPRMGRCFTAADMVANSPGVAVLSYETWRDRFQSDPEILGRPITLGNQRFTVVGVAGEALHTDAKVDLWTPLPIAERGDDRSNAYNIVGRLRPGVTRAQAQADFENVLLRLKNTYPALWNDHEGIRVLDFHDSLTGQIRPALQMLMGAVALVLLIVSANILSLLLTVSIGRRREMGLRAALGATEWRILRQLLVENALLCVVGAGLGVVFATLAAPALLRISPIDLPDFTSLHMGGSAIAFSLALTAGCALLFTVVPIFESRRTQLAETLRQNSNQIAGGRNWAQKFLVVGEVAISLVLVVAAALLLNSFWRLSHAEAGFRTGNVLTFKTTYSADQSATTASLARLEEELKGRVESIPGVESAASVFDLPTQLMLDLPFDIMGRKPSQPGSGGDESYMPITSDYFDALSIPVASGRSFAASDMAGSLPVLIVNQQFARSYFKGQSALGQQIRIGAAMGPGFEDPPRVIVGVVGDTLNKGLDQPAPAILYLPKAQIPDTITKMGNGFLGSSWVVRTRSADAVAPIRSVFLQTAHVPLLSVEPMADVVSASVAQQRFSMLLTCGFGLISLLLGAAGLYAVMSYTVVRRTKEIGVRLALGAQHGDIVRMVLREAGLLVGGGISLGVLISLGISNVLRSLLFGVAPRDPATIAAMCGVLLLTGILSAWWPALRAANTEPNEALRME